MVVVDKAVFKGEVEDCLEAVLAGRDELRGRSSVEDATTAVGAAPKEAEVVFFFDFLAFTLSRR